MNCEKCQALLSSFIDGELKTSDSADVQTHLALCAVCAQVFEDFAEIVGFCSEKPVGEIGLPNSPALWCRISNIIESEAKPEVEKGAPEKRVGQGFFSRMWNYTWRLSGAQLVSSVLGIALVSSLLTIVGLKNAAPENDFSSAAAAAPPSLFEKALSRVGLIETPQAQREKQIRERQTTIEYWDQRVRMRRAQWDKHLREAFDRNLDEIDQVVFEYKRTLQENPQDELTGEMLDSALTEKMELLREFSEL